ncbi:MAG: hypothetical protein ACFFC7_22835 [Candidatus Hermodarchaeota archaeon]
MDRIYVQELEYGKHLDWKRCKNQKEIYLTVFSKNRAKIIYILQETVQSLSVTLDKEIKRPGKFISVQNPSLKEENHIKKLSGIVQELDLTISPTMLELARKSCQDTLSLITAENLHRIAYLPQARSTITYVPDQTFQGKFQNALINHSGKELVFEFRGPNVPSSHSIVKRWVQIFPILTIKTQQVQKVYITIRGELLE